MYTHKISHHILKLDCHEVLHMILVYPFLYSGQNLELQDTRVDMEEKVNIIETHLYTDMEFNVGVTINKHDLDFTIHTVTCSSPFVVDVPILISRACPCRHLRSTLKWFKF